MYVLPGAGLFLDMTTVLPYLFLVWYGMLVRYPKEIMKMERHFRVLQRWLQKIIKNNNSHSNFDFT